MKELQSSPAKFAHWLAEHPDDPPARSIVIGSRCSADLKRIGEELAAYLNEFDEQAAATWRAFSHEDLYRLAGDPLARDLILGNAELDPHSGAPDSDLDRVARRIARHGCAIILGQYGLDATDDLETVFRVCLCGNNPVCIDPCHIWLNSTSFTRGSLIAVIADSFLDWATRRSSTQPVTCAESAQNPANRAEPDGRHCASL